MIALEVLPLPVLQYAIPIVFASMKRLYLGYTESWQRYCLLCLTLNRYIPIFSNRSQVSVRKIFYSSSQNNVQNRSINEWNILLEPISKIRLEFMARRETVKKRSIHVVCEHFEPFRNTAMGT